MKTMPDAETLYYKLRETVGDLYINDDADKRLADAATAIAEDPENQDGS